MRYFHDKSLPLHTSAAKTRLSDGNMLQDQENVYPSSVMEFPLPSAGTVRGEYTIEEISELFSKFDLDSSGKLSYLSLKSALKYHEVSCTDSMIRDWLRKHDTHRKGYVDFSDFCKIFAGGHMTYFAENEGIDAFPIDDEVVDSTKTTLLRRFVFYE